MVDAVATIEYDNVGYGIGIITPCSAITRGRGRCLRKDHRASTEPHSHPGHFYFQG